MSLSHGSVLLLPPEHDGLSVGELFWLVLVSDYVLKLATVLLKALITLLPHSFLHYQNRVRANPTLLLSMTLSFFLGGEGFLCMILIIAT